MSLLYVKRLAFWMSCKIPTAPLTRRPRHCCCNARTSWGVMEWPCSWNRLQDGPCLGYPALISLYGFTSIRKLCCCVPSITFWTISTKCNTVLSCSTSIGVVNNSINLIITWVLIVSIVCLYWFGWRASSLLGELAQASVSLSSTTSAWRCVCLLGFWGGLLDVVNSSSSELTVVLCSFLGLLCFLFSVLLSVCLGVGWSDFGMLAGLT